MERSEVKFTPRIGNIVIPSPESQSLALERRFQSPELVADSSHLIHQLVAPIGPIDISEGTIKLGLEQFRTSVMTRLAQARRIRRRRKEDPVLYGVRDEESGETVKFSDAQREVIHYWLANFDTLPLNSETEQLSEVLEPRIGLKSWARSHLTDERIGYHLGKWLARNTPSDLQPKIFSTVESMAGTPLVLPSEQSRAIGQGLREETSLNEGILERASSKVYRTFLSVEDPELRMGHRVLDAEGLRIELNEVLSKKRLSKDERKVANYWLKNFDRLPIDQTLFGKVWGIAVEDRLSDLGNLAKLGLLTSGLGMRSLGEKIRFEPAERLGESLAILPSFFQTNNDVANIADFSKTEKDRKVLTKEVAERYGLDNIKMRVLTHPDLGGRLIKSGGLGVTIYIAPRYILGYAAYFGLLYAPEFRSFVDTVGPTATATLATGILGFGMGARAVIDSKVLERHQYSPDYFETIFANTNGQINEKNKLVASSAWGKFGPALDIFVSGFTPMFAWGWYLDEPYSRYAYALSCYVDQVVFSTTNVIWSTVAEGVKKQVDE